MNRRVGIYSGTFDPIHQGHITFALESMRSCQLNSVFILPEPEPRQKQNVTDIDKRTSLIDESIAKIDGLSIIRPSSKQFTIKDTLPQLFDMFKDADITLLVGSDVVKTFPNRWQDLDILLEKVSLAIGMRANDNSDEIEQIITDLQQDLGLVIDYKLIRTPDSHITSSQIRTKFDD